MRTPLGSSEVARLALQAVQQGALHDPFVVLGEGMSRIALLGSRRSSCSSRPHPAHPRAVVDTHGGRG